MKGGEYMADNFFEDPNAQIEQPEVSVEPEKIKLGEKEYTQDELQRLVGLGEIGVEAEKQYKTSIKSVWPKYQQVINEKRELEQRFNQTEEQRKAYEEQVRKFEAESTPKQSVTPAQPQFTPEQIREAALKQAEELGIGPQAIRKTVMEVIQGQTLINDISASIDEGTEEGWIKDTDKATVENVLAHMQQEGIRNPMKALRDMFEDDYVQAQAEKLSKLREGREGLPTIQSSTAGAKQPTPTNFKRMSDADLTALVNDSVREAFQ